MIKDPLGPIEEDDADERDSELYDSKVDSQKTAPVYAERFDFALLN